MANDVVRDIVTGMKTQIADQLGSSWAELPYTNDVADNNFNSGHQRYGVRAGSVTQTETVTRVITVTQTFDVVLTNKYVNSGLSDTDAREKWYDLQSEMHDIFVRLVNTKAGVPASIIDVQELSWVDPQYIEDEKVVVLTASMEIRYRYYL